MRAVNVIVEKNKVIKRQKNNSIVKDSERYQLLQHIMYNFRTPFYAYMYYQNSTSSMHILCRIDVIKSMELLTFVFSLVSILIFLQSYELYSHFYYLISLCFL